MQTSSDKYKASLERYRAMVGIDRSSERLAVGSQPNSDLLYRNAAQAYRSQQLNRIQATWLNSVIPWKVFITLNVLLANSKSVDVVKDVIFIMLRMASYRYGEIMSSALAIEAFPDGPDIHVHLAVGSEAAITSEWFEGYLSRFHELRYKVLPYSSETILSYVLKTTETELRNCEPYLKPATTSRERRRLRRMEERSQHEQQ